MFTWEYMYVSQNNITQHYLQLEMTYPRSSTIFLLINTQILILTGAL